MFGGSLPVEVTVASDVNQQSPIAVDLLVVYERPVLEALRELTAKDWFEQREQLRRDHPGAFEAWSWEWVPGQDVPTQELHYGVGAKAGIVFADYFTPGSHRAVLDPHRPIRLALGRDDFVVAPREEGDNSGRRTE
jgi:type VI secretion system protein